MFPGSGSGAPRPMNSGMHILRRLFAIALAVAGCDRARSRCGDAGARDDVVSWTSPTPVRAPSSASRRRRLLSFRLGATSDGSGAMLAIRDSEGARRRARRSDTPMGIRRSATYTWKPPVSQVGLHRVTFRRELRGAGSAARRTLAIRVGAREPATAWGGRDPAAVYPRRALLSDRGCGNVAAGRSFGTARLPAPARRARLARSRRVTFRTAELYRNAIQVLDQGHVQGREDVGADPARESCPTARPAGCRAGALATIEKVHTRMVIGGSGR